MRSGPDEEWPLSTERGWRWAAASIAGTSHLTTGTVCQDAHAAAVRPDGALVAAVADGAGSAAHSARGAAGAVAAAVGAMAGHTRHAGSGDSGSGDVGPPSWDDEVAALTVALRAARAAIDVLAEADALSTRELACTLSCVIARPDGVLAAQIGDGLVVAVGPDGALSALTTAERGDYANETTFLTSDGAVEAALEGMTRADGDVSAVVLLTDGLLRLALDLATATPHAAFFQPLVRFAAAIDDTETATAQLAAFLASPRVRARADDDLTLLVAALGPAER